MKAFVGGLMLLGYLTWIFDGYAQQTRYVAQGGQMPDSMGKYTNWISAASNIQDAVDASEFYDTILVSNGDYIVDIGNYVVHISGLPGLRLMAVNTDPGDTVIVGRPHSDEEYYGENSVAGILLEDGSDDTFISGFTFSNCYTMPGGFGGAAYVRNSLRVTISNCYATHCRADRNGGAFRYYNNIAAQSIPDNLLITHSVMSNNWSGPNAAGNGGGAVHHATILSCLVITNGTDTYGGGVMDCVVCNSEIIHNIAYGRGGGMHASPATNCLIMGNSAGTDGGGVNLTSNGRLVNCLVVSNNAQGYGGGIAKAASTHTNVSVINCTIGFNHTSKSVGTAVGRYYIHFINSIVVSNTGITPGYENWNWSQTPAFLFSHSNTDPLPTGGADLGGNINKPPDFSGGTDYRLQPTSPCVNMGTNEPWMATTVDLDGRTRIDRMRRIVDMGCYEHIPSGMLFYFH